MPYLPAHKRKLRPRSLLFGDTARIAVFHMRWSRGYAFAPTGEKKRRCVLLSRKGRRIGDRQAAAQALAPHTSAFPLLLKRTIPLPPRILLHPDFCSADSTLCGVRR